MYLQKLGLAKPI